MNIIEFKSLSYKYPDSTDYVLIDVSFSVNKGEFLVITGPSGCGKTTLCRFLNGLIPHFYGGVMQGDVIVDGLSIRETPIRILSQRVGMVFQDPESQLFSLTVEREIAFGLENLGLSRDEILSRIDEVLMLVNIAHLKHRHPYELSGGEQQKVALAACLAMKPKIIVLDEPTAHLDPVSAYSLLNLLNELKHKLSITVVLVEHRLEALISFSDRFIIMDKGRILFNGSVKEVFSSINDIKKIGIGVPKIIELYHELKKNGIILNDIPLTPKSFREALLEMMLDD